MDDHWLTRESTIKRLWIVFAIVLACIVLVDLVVHHHAYFGARRHVSASARGSDSRAASLLIVAAKALGWILKRPDTYYDS